MPQTTPRNSILGTKSRTVKGLRFYSQAKKLANHYSKDVSRSIWERSWIWNKGLYYPWHSKQHGHIPVSSSYTQVPWGIMQWAQVIPAHIMRGTLGQEPVTFFFFNSQIIYSKFSYKEVIIPYFTHRTILILREKEVYFGL